MILPTKHLPTERSLLGVGALLLEYLNSSRTISSLWDQVHKIAEVGSFERFILTLDLLYAIDAIEIKDGLLRKCYL